MSRKKLLIAMAALSALLMSPTAAEEYPSRPVRVIVPFAAGGAVDLVARLLGQRLSTQLGQPVVIENRLGAAGTVGAASVARSEPDGHTLLFTANSSQTTAPHLSKSPLYDALKDFTPIATVLDYSFILVTNPNVPVKSVPELIDYARTNPDRLRFSSAGVGSGPHLAGELLKMATGAPMLHVPYKGTAPAMTAVITGEVDCLFDTTGTAINYINGGQVRALAVSSATRNRALPDLPTMIEAGVPGFEVIGWYGFLGPANVPAPITNKIFQALQTILKEPAIDEQLRRQGFDTRLSPPDEFAARLKSDYELWGKAVKQANIGKE